MNLADVLPGIHNWWEFVFSVLFLYFQWRQFKVLHTIKRQTNGMLQVTADAAKAAGEAIGVQKEQARVAVNLATADEVTRLNVLARSEGESEGRMKEQSRVAAKLALADEAALRLEEEKRK